jgi:cleavage stimulation factor subunit 2
MAQSGSTKISSADQSARSVFVGNISYDVTEEQLKQVFTQVGQVIHFRLVHDRDTGRPKGFGFCEFAEPQMADAAIRNLNGVDLNGRPLRVDSATGKDRTADEVQQLQMALAGQTEESPYGPEPELGKAPEAIARTVASMPPERMFELMKQMKEAVINNPNMARQLLLENPQLAYALLQAQVVMRVVDPKVAYSMLHRETPATTQPFHQGFPGGPPPPTGGIPPPPRPFNGAPNVAPPNMPPPNAGMSQQIRTGPPPAQPYMQQMGPISGGPPPHIVASRPPPVRPQPSAVPTQSNDTSEEEQAQMLLKVLQLTPEQINLLPPEDRQKVIELRNQLRTT